MQQPRGMSAHSLQKISALQCNMIEARRDTRRDDDGDGGGALRRAQTAFRNEKRRGEERIGDPLGIRLNYYALSTVA